MRPKIKEEFPKATFGRIAKIIGQRWKELSDEEKKVWQDKAQQEAEE